MNNVLEKFEEMNEREVSERSRKIVMGQVLLRANKR